MDQTPLVNELIEAGVRFLDEFTKCYPVAVAFWLKDRDESQWYLHIASQNIKDGKTREAYGDVLRIAGEMQNPPFDPFRVKLRMMDDPIVRFAQECQRRYPAHASTVANVPAFEGVDVESMYLYPSVKAAA